MVVVLPEPLTPTTRITNGLPFAATTSGCATGAMIFSTSRPGPASPRRDCGSGPRPSRSRCAPRRRRRDRRGSASSSISSMRSGVSGPRITRSEMAVPMAPDVRFNPPASRCHQLALVPVLSFMPSVRDSGSVKRNQEDDPGRDSRSPALSRRADADHRQARGLCRAQGPEGRRKPGGLFRRAALRPAARARAGAPARPRHLRLPGARPPPQGAGHARQAVQGRQGRQDLLGGGRRRPHRGRGPHRSAARPPRRQPRLVDEGRSRRGSRR